MTSYVIDLTWWVTKKTYDWTYWLLWGTPETLEQKLINQQTKRLEHLERRVEQLWLLSRNCDYIQTHNTPNMSFLLCDNDNDDGDDGDNINHKNMHPFLASLLSQNTTPSSNHESPTNTTGLESPNRTSN